jgi:acetyl esterase/lipase
MRAHIRKLPVLIALACATPATVAAQTYIIPFSEIRDAVDTTGEPPDVVIRAHLAGLIRSELDDLGLNFDSDVIFSDIPIEEITEIIETDCDFPQPYEIHTDATTATVVLDDGSSLTLGLDSIRNISLNADLTGDVSTAADAWVRWGQDIPFGEDCAKLNTDHGWVALDVPFDINLDLALELTPRYDPLDFAVVIDKYAFLQGQAVIDGGQLEHDFGTLSLTDVLINLFEDELLQKLQTNGELAVADAIAELNFRLDGLDEDGLPDPTITAFNAPTTFQIDVSPEDKAFIQGLLERYGIPELVIAMLEDEAIEVLLQLAILQDAEREAYLASLGASVSCDVLLAAFQTPLNSVPIYTLNNQNCERANLSAPDAAEYFVDSACTEAAAYRSTDDAEYCAAYVGDQAESILGNAAVWVADANQVNDPLPNVASRAWTNVPGTQLDLGALPLTGNLQPYMKQVNYRTIGSAQRGTGSCELEMRIYKNDLAATGLRPLIALHGGTWRSRGSSFLGLESGISHLTEQGFIVFAPFYRLTGETDGNVECNAVTWREVTADAEAALDWVVANGAALGAAPGPVNVFGQSAGAHLAGWLAAHRPDDVRKALMNYGPIDALEFLQGAIPFGGPYDAFRNFGLRSLARLFGAEGGSNELHLEHIDFAGLTVTMLQDEWDTVIPASAFDLTLMDPLAPPLYVSRCADSTQTDLALVNPGMPPAELTACLKQELRDFLIENSFAHQLADEVVPVHVLHGTADSLVPYQQALELCGAIDDRVFPSDVVGPLTRYSCGNNSEVQLVGHADHALELGVCIDSVCPAGDASSETRAAVVTAIEASYEWLLRDSAAPEPEPPAPDKNEDDSGGSGANDPWTIISLLLIALGREFVGGRRRPLARDSAQ